MRIRESASITSGGSQGPLHGINERRRKTRSIICAAVVCSGFAFETHTDAGTYSWVDTTTTATSWTNPANWSGSPNTYPNGSSDAAIFSGSTLGSGNTITLGQTITLNYLLLGGTLNGSPFLVGTAADVTNGYTLTMAGSNAFIGEFATDRGGNVVVPIAGSGVLTLSNGGSYNVMNIENNNTYTGIVDVTTSYGNGTFLNQNYEAVALTTANASLSDDAAINVFNHAYLYLGDNGYGSNASNRLGTTGTGTVSLIGGAIAGYGSASASNGDIIDTLNVGGSNVLQAQADTAKPYNYTMTINNLNRVDGGSLFVNGTNLGENATSTGVGRILLGTNAATTVANAMQGQLNSGASSPLPTGDPGSQVTLNTAIVPFMVGEATSTTGGTGTILGTPNTFVTYTATGGFRPLNVADEFVANNLAAASGDNFILT